MTENNQVTQSDKPAVTKISEWVAIIGGSVGILSALFVAVNALYIEPQQNISQINRNIKDIIGRIKEINKELSELNERILEIEKNKLEQSDLNKTSNELLNLKSVISRLEKGKVDYDVFNQYKPLSKGDVDWIINSIKSLQGTTNLSKQIQYYSKKIDDIQKISYCYVANDFGGYSSNRECVENKSKDLEDANNKLFELQKKLSR